MVTCLIGENRIASRTCHSACFPEPKTTRLYLVDDDDVGWPDTDEDHRVLDNRVIVTNAVRNAVISVAFKRPSSFPSAEYKVMDPSADFPGTRVTVLTAMFVSSDEGMTSVAI